MKIVISKVMRLVILLLVAVILTACAPHPGAGKWQAINKNGAVIAALSVHFEGKAEFETGGREKVIWHCFWAARGKQEIVLNCVPSTDVDTKQEYQLLVDNIGQAQLSSQGEVIGHFERQLPDR